MTDEMQRLLDELRERTNPPCRDRGSEWCLSQPSCRTCARASVDAVEREVAEHHVELPVRIKARQAVERENSRLLGQLADASRSRDAWAAKCRQARGEREALRQRESQLVGLLRDARDEYVRASRRSDERLAHAAAWREAYHEASETIEEMEGRTMLQCIGCAIVGAIVGFGAAAMLAAGRDNRD